MGKGKEKKTKKDKKDKKDKKKKMSKEDKKSAKLAKKNKKVTAKSQVANSTNSAALTNARFVNLVSENTKKAATGALGPKAKTAAEEWAAAGKAPGLQIWRIENFCIVPWPREEFGHFYNGDSYIVLNTYKSGNAFRWDIHFWLGEKTSQDEAGTAAYKTVELDDQLGGTPVQHREVQDYESDLFLSYFKPSITILHGGVESGFTHVTPEEYETRLLHLKGKRTVRVSQVSVDSDSLNSGDVFVLDGGLTIYQWNGKQSSVNERNKGNEVARALRDERKSQPKVFTIEEGQEDPKFWELLGGQGPIGSAEEGGSDAEAERDRANTKALFQLSDASGKLTLTKINAPKITRAVLKSADAFIFDAGFEIFAWIGKGASPQEKRLAIGYAQDYLSQNNRPAYLPITKVVEGCEPESMLATLDK